MDKEIKELLTQYLQENKDLVENIEFKKLLSPIRLNNFVKNNFYIMDKLRYELINLIKLMEDKGVYQPDYYIIVYTNGLDYMLRIVEDKNNDWEWKIFNTKKEAQDWVNVYAGKKVQQFLEDEIIANPFILGMKR